MSEELQRVDAVSPRSEWIKFGVLAIMMLGAVLAIALVRPYIFNTIVPAVMGQGSAQPGSNEVEIHIPLMTDSPREAESSEENSTEADGPINPPAAEAYPAPDAIEAEEETVIEGESEGVETAVSTIDHLVQPNENLTNIANQYNTTIQAILDVNDIPNPNRIDAGTILRIPQP